MHYTLETTDAAIIDKLKPLLRIIESYKGHINKSYTHGADWVSADNYHRDELLKLLRQHDQSKLFGIGSGGSHIWISHPLAGEEEYKVKISERVVLITDKVERI